MLLEVLANYNCCPWSFTLNYSFFMSKNFALTDHKKLPFMAMLRNLKNMITAGLKEKYHNLVLHRLTDEVYFLFTVQFFLFCFENRSIMDWCIFVAINICNFVLICKYYFPKFSLHYAILVNKWKNLSNSLFYWAKLGYNRFKS